MYPRNQQNCLQSTRELLPIIYWMKPAMPVRTIQRFSRAGPRGRGREWATLGVHPLSWLLSNNRLEKVPVVSVPHTSSNRLLLGNQDKGCTPSVAHSLPLPLGPALLNLSNYNKRMLIPQDCVVLWMYCMTVVRVKKEQKFVQSLMAFGTSNISSPLHLLYWTWGFPHTRITGTLNH